MFFYWEKSVVNRKVVSIALLLTILSSMLTHLSPIPPENVRGNGGLPKLVADSATARPGDQFDIMIWLDVSEASIPCLRGWEIEIGWNATRLDCKGCVLPAGHAFDGLNITNPAPVIDNNYGDVVKMAIVNEPHGPAITSNKPLCRLTFQLISEYLDELSPALVSLQFMRINDYGTLMINDTGALIPFEAVNGRVFVSKGYPEYLVDDFNYSSLAEMKGAGWNVEPDNLVSVAGGNLTLDSDGSQGSSVSWQGFPIGVSDYTVEARVFYMNGSYGGPSANGNYSFKLEILTERHNYTFLALGPEIDPYGKAWGILVAKKDDNDASDQQFGYFSGPPRNCMHFRFSKLGQTIDWFARAGPYETLCCHARENEPDSTSSLMRVNLMTDFNSTVKVDFIAVTGTGLGSPFRVDGYGAEAAGGVVLGRINATSSGASQSKCIKFEVMNWRGETVHEENQTALFPADQTVPVMFMWPSGDLPPGNYYTRFKVYDSTWTQALIYNSGWFLGFTITEPIFVWNFGELNASEHRGFATSLELSRGQKAILNFSLATCVEYLRIEVQATEKSDFILEVGNGTFAQSTRMYLSYYASSFTVSSVPEGTYNISLDTMSNTALLKDVWIETGPEVTPTVDGWALIDETRATIEKLEGLNGTTRTYNLRAGYCTNMTDQIAFSITNQTSGDTLHSETTSAPCFVLSSLVTFKFTYQFPNEWANTTLTFNLTFLAGKTSLVWEVPIISKKLEFDVDLRYSTPTYFKKPSGCLISEQPFQQVNSQDMEALSVSDVKILDIKVENGTLKYVTLGFKAKNIYSKSLLFWTWYVYYELSVYPVGICKNVGKPLSLLIYDETEDFVVPGVPVVYVDDSPRVEFSITFQKSLWNVVDFFLSKFLKIVLDQLGLPNPGPLIMEIMHKTYDMLATEMTADDVNGLLIEDFRWDMDLIDSFLGDNWGEVSLSYVGAQVGYFTIIKAAVDKNPNLSGRFIWFIIEHVLNDFRSKPELLIKMIGCGSSEMIKSWAGKLLLVFDVADAIGDAIVKLFAPDAERKTTVAGLTAPIQSPFKEVVLGDPKLQVSFSGNVSDSSFNDTRLYNVDDLSFNTTKTSDGTAFFTLAITPQANYAGDFISFLSDPDFCTSLLNYFDVITDNATLLVENQTIYVKGNGTSPASYEKFYLHINNQTVDGYMYQPFSAPVTDSTWHVDLPMVYPFGENLTYAIDVVLPVNSSDICVLSGGNYTIQDTTVSWNEPVQNIIIDFTQYHDIAVTDLEPLKTVVGKGCRLPMNVTTRNLGNYNEAFGLFFWANENRASADTDYCGFNLAPANSMTVTANWDTQYQYYLPYGNYTMTACISPVQWEANIDNNNNNLTSITIYLGIPGDINADGIVELMDFYHASNAYLSRPGKVNWNPNADINSDDVVEMMDFFIMSQHYLEHE
jgi:hypothetical protein